MKKILATVLASAAALAGAQATEAAVKGTLNVRLVPTQLNDSGLFDVAIQVQSIGVANAGQGDGGVSDFGFTITSVGTGNANALAAGVGPLAGKAKITWNPAVTSAFSVVGPNRTDVGGDGDFDVIGGAYFDTNNFTDADFAVDVFTTVATLQFQLTNPAASETLNIVTDNVQAFDFLTGEGNGFRSTFATINATGAVIAIPEPASIGLLALGGLALAARRRQA